MTSWVSIARGAHAKSIEQLKQEADDNLRLQSFPYGRLLYAYTQKLKIDVPVDAICYIGFFLMSLHRVQSFNNYNLHLPRKGVNIMKTWNISDKCCFTSMSPYTRRSGNCIIPVHDFNQYYFKMVGGLNHYHLTIEFYGFASDPRHNKRPDFILDFNIQNLNCNELYFGEGKTVREFVADCFSFTYFLNKFGSERIKILYQDIRLDLFDPRHNFWKLRQFWGIVQTLKNSLHPE